MGPLGWFLVGFFTAFVIVGLGIVLSCTMLSSKISREEEADDWHYFA